MHPSKAKKKGLPNGRQSGGVIAGSSIATQAYHRLTGQRVSDGFLVAAVKNRVNRNGNLNPVELSWDLIQDFDVVMDPEHLEQFLRKMIDRKQLIVNPPANAEEETKEIEGEAAENAKNT